MDCKIIELRADRNLLRSNFDGYKLSLEPVAIVKEKLQATPDRVHQSDAQYSFLHAELFSLQNHLIHDPWTSDTSYYIDTTWMVRRVQYGLQEGRFKPIGSVFRVRKSAERLAGHFNLTIVFISEKFAVIGDGVAWIEIVDTGDRTRAQEWKQLAHVRAIPDEKAGFVLRDARLEIQEECRKIHCLLMRIEQTDGVFESVLEWIAIDLSEKKVSTHRELRSRSSIFYSVLTSNSSGVIVAAGKAVKFTYDSENPIVDDIPNVQEEDYTWKQTDEDIVITFREREEAEKSDYQVKFIGKEISVQFKEDIVLKGELFAEIDKDLTTWNLHNKSFQVTLVKSVEGENWPHLLPGERLEEESQPNESEIFSLDNKIEDCDRGDDDADHFLARFDGGTHRMTHKANLGSCSPLFALPSLRPGQPAAIALRHDVDCCLWLPLQTPGEWILRHEGTLDAFAYVLASKQQRKYVSCAPDLSYAVICEPERHVFIYKAKYDTATGLRKRSGPQVTLGQQKVVSLENAGGQVIGMTVLNEVTLLLTEESILSLQVNIEQ
ncbi:nudC domain-containing protein 1 [Phlebotomus argentipes]|uniref:nudC domain-containing protein 1 n=1 Tax=Phlebotomus argentipes TaxID=94469 RepID=UPI0028931A9F|nr:nudC domain-containing protein 1 [Phlebotomus argentipes]